MGAAVYAQAVGLNAMTTMARQRSQWGEFFLLTFPFIGLVREVVRVQRVDATLACSLLAGVWNL